MLPKGRFKIVLVFKLDRAFRSVKHMYDTLEAWEAVGVSFQSVRERFDTGSGMRSSHRTSTEAIHRVINLVQPN